MAYRSSRFVHFFLSLFNKMKFMRNLYIIFVFFLLIPLLGNSQAYHRLKYELYYGIGGSNLMGDVSAPSDPNKLIWVKMFNTIGPVGNIGLRYNIENRHHVNGKIFLGQLYAEDPTGDPNFWDRGLRSSSFFTEISANYEFFIVQPKRRQTVYRMLGETSLKNLSIPTYVFIGVGGIVNFGTFTQRQDKVVISEFHFNAAPVVPLGIGFKTSISRNTMFGIEAGYRLAINDKIDFASGKESTSFGEWYDQYQFITFNLSHKIRSNTNGWPKFKRR